MIEDDMESKRALGIVLWISVLGMLFSGYLSFTELTAGVCAVGGCQALLGVPTCVYGFVMYLVVFIFCILGNEKAMLWVEYSFKRHKLQ